MIIIVLDDDVEDAEGGVVGTNGTGDGDPDGAGEGWPVEGGPDGPDEGGPEGAGEGDAELDTLRIPLMAGVPAVLLEGPA